MTSSDEKLSALLKDLNQLSEHLHKRGERSLMLSKQFAANAQKDASNREFDLNQAKMLDYQHSLLHEIGNLVDKLIKRYER
ncbi:MAG TPA: hypothetical protein VFN02_06580 [Ktedonobacteraceae bacterium]|jgi:hypothetical protein|nr:hypothetical protein [Ktedonobacteraceae bacterium]